MEGTGNENSAHVASGAYDECMWSALLVHCERIEHTGQRLLCTTVYMLSALNVRSLHYTLAPCAKNR